MQTSFSKKYFLKIHQNIADFITLKPEKIFSIITREINKKNKKK